jgi:hypothetical protein
MNPEVRRKATVWLVLVFVLGAATGGVFGYNLAHRSYAANKPAVLSEEQRRTQKVEEMTREIGLNAEQAKKTEGIIAEAQAEGRAVRDKSDAEMDAVRQRARSAMRTFLTPEQLPKFEQYVARLDAERKKQREMQGH